MRRMLKQKNKSGVRILIAVVIVALFSITFWLFNSRNENTAEAAWYDESWLYRSRLTIDSSKVDADLTDFPVAVSLTTSRFTYANAQANGEDIRFTTQDGRLLPYEIEKWDTSATSTIWVKLPKVYANTDTEFYMYYGNASATDNQSPQDVWDDNYVAVYHLSEDPSGTAPQINDSTSNNNDGTSNGAMTSTDQVAGKVDGSLDFDGVDDYVSISDDPSIRFSTVATWSWWAKFNSAPDTKSGILEKTNNGDNNDGFFIFDFSQVGAGVVRLTTRSNGGDGNYDSPAGWQQVDNKWHHYTITWQNNTTNGIKFYKDGVLSQQSNSANTPIGTPNDGALTIAYSPFFNDYIGGFFDDVHVSNTARSAAWVKASYNSGADSLLTYGTEEKGPGPVAYWKFDEGFGSTAYNFASATGTDGTITGAKWRDESMCVSGKCLEFDGVDDEVSIANFDPPSIATVSVWAKPADSSSNKALIGGHDAWEVLFWGNGTIYHQLWAGGSSDLRTQTYTNFVNEWHHYVFTYNGTTNRMEIYIDGVFKDANNNANDDPGIITLLIGNSSAAGREFKGFIDEVKIYNYARSAAEIKQDYLKGAASRGSSAVLGAQDWSWMSDGLVGYWKMDESSANTCSGGVNDSCDSSGAGNDGAWNGNATATTTAKFGRAVEFDGTGDYIEVPDFDL